MFRLSVICTLVLAATVLADPPRPVIPDDFEAEVHNQFEEHNRTFIGEGRIACDYKNNRLASLHVAFDHEHKKMETFNLDRYDEGHSYTIHSNDRAECKVGNLTGHVDNFFAWVKTATYAGQKKTPHHQTVDLWTKKMAGITLTVGVLEDEPNAPLIFERESTSTTEKFFFMRFNATTPAADIFKVPAECTTPRKPVRAPVKADPARPVIPETFVAAVESQLEEHNRTFLGRGKFAIDMKTNEFVEIHETEDHEHHKRFSYNLDRFDLEKAYHIDSSDKTKCEEKPLKGHVEPVFEWVKNATYVGKKQTPKHQTVDVWERKVAGGVTLILGVLEEEKDRPLIFERHFPHGAEKFFFLEFNGTTPEAKDFDVPAECKQSVRADPPRPRIAETFVADFDILIEMREHKGEGKGKMACNVQTGMFAQIAEVKGEGNHSMDVHEVARYDKHEYFSVDSLDHKCTKHQLHGDIVPPFRWVEQAKYEGEKTVGKKQIKVQVWGQTVGTFTQYIGVLASDPHRPVFFAQSGPRDKVEIEFVRFNGTTPEAADFDIPKECL